MEKIWHRSVLPFFEKNAKITHFNSEKMFGIKVRHFYVFSKTTRRISAKFFYRVLGQNTCLLKLALKNTAPGL